MRIRLVVADVDGTLVGPAGGIGAHAREAVRLSRERGATFTLATGRIFPSAAAVARELGIDAPIIAGGGTVVAYPCGREISRLLLDGDVALQILRLSSGPGCRGAVLAEGVVARYAFVRDSIFTDIPGPHAETYSNSLRVPVNIVDDLSAVVVGGITQVVLRVNPDAAPALLNRLGPAIRGAARVVRSLPHLLEFTHPRASKGRALETLCSHLGVPTSAVLAIGDGGSDTDMLAVAGASAVVANAPEWLRGRCRWVTRSAYAAGVLEAVRDVVCGARSSTA